MAHRISIRLEVPMTTTDSTTNTPRYRADWTHLVTPPRRSLG